MQLSDESKAVLEELVDADSLDGVLEALAAICREKADHIRANYDDRSLARAWAIAGIRLEILAGKGGGDMRLCFWGALVLGCLLCGSA
jgi:hypothetical protein